MPATIQNAWACLALYIITAVLSFLVLGFLLLVIVVGFGSDLARGKIGLADLLGLPILALLLWVSWRTLGTLIIFPWISIRNARQRRYVLTDRQAVTIHESPDSVQLERADLADVLEPSLTRKRKDGVGDVIFGGYVVKHYTGDGGMEFEAFHDTGFTACPKAERVAALFAEARLRRRDSREREDIKEMGQDYQGWLRRQGRL